MASGLARKYKVGRRVDDTGDCGFDALLAQLEDPRIRATIDPIVWRGITSIQGSYFTFYIFSNNKKSISSSPKDLELSNKSCISKLIVILKPQLEMR